MQLSKRLATALLPRLLSKVNGAPALPGSEAAFTAMDAEGQNVAAISRGDAIDLWLPVRGSDEVVQCPLDYKLLRSLVYWLVVSWWARAGWFGLRWVAWRWCVKQLHHKTIDEAKTVLQP